MKSTNKPILPDEKINIRAVLLLMLLSCFWGGNAVAMKIALNYMDPFILAGLRFALGAIVIALWSIFNKIDIKPKRSDIPHLIIISLIFAAQICTFNLGTKYTLAGRTSLFINTHPFFVAFIAHFFIPNDRLSVRKVAGLILAFTGIFVVMRDKIGMDGSRVMGDVIILISGFILGILGVYTKILVQKINAYKLLLWQMIFGLVPFFVLSLIFERSSPYTLSSNVILALLYQGIIVAAFSFVVWTLLLKRHSASKTSAFLFATPLFGVGLSSIILGEVITPYLTLGAILVAAGIYVVNKSDNRRDKFPS
jgi:drug/metabolite transporter (DMT)-like permease